MNRTLMTTIPRIQESSVATNCFSFSTKKSAMHRYKETLEHLFDELASQEKWATKQSRSMNAQQAARRIESNNNDVGAKSVLSAWLLLVDKPEQCVSLANSINNDIAKRVKLRLLGHAHFQLNELTISAEKFDASLAINACQPTCWNMLAIIALRQNKLSIAISSLRNAMALGDETNQSTLMLSQIYQKRNQLNEAIHCLRVALLRDKRSPDLNVMLARILVRKAERLKCEGKEILRQRLLVEALQCYRTANAVTPKASNFVMQGQLERRLDLQHESDLTFRKAADLDKNHLIAQTQLAASEVSAGHIDRGVERFEEIINMSPTQAGAHFRYCRAKKFKPSSKTNEYLATLKQCVDDRKRPISQQILVNFSLAKVYDDLGNYDDAWQHYEFANRLKKGHSDAKQRPPKGDSTAQPMPLQFIANESIRYFTEDRFKALSNAGNDSQTPTFIVGMPRSGTTLTEQILSSHPSIAGAGELTLIDRIRHHLVSQYRQSTYPHLLSQINHDQLSHLASRYLSRLDEYRTNELRVTDKMPTNFMHLGLIAILFPKARIIHCRRNALDVFVSCYCQNLSAPFCDLEQLLVYYKNYRKMMQHWESVLPIPIHHVDYESLVTNPRTRSHEIIDYCGLPWNDRCLQFQESKRSVHTPSKWQVRQPMYTSSIQKWKRFEKHLGHIQLALSSVESSSSHV